ncbi:MAG TPA: ester cyclase [Thermomicrobiaceae bacterium]|nr:ester cyclase [Thermomicrobiaceae bacterium]
MADLTETEERNLRAVSEVLPFWNSHDVAGVLTFYDPDITWHNVALEETYRGQAEVGAFLDRLFVAFPDLDFTVSEKIARDDRVSERWTIRGTHLGPFMGIPPTGRPIEIPGMSMVHLRDGRFLEDRFYFDASGVLRQMGLLPSLAASQTRVARAALWVAVNRVPAALALGVVLAGAVARRRRG